MQQEMKWRYYNHALLPTTAPHEEADTAALQRKDIWKAFGERVLLARWTSDFDCNENTCWWYTIKDTPFDFMDVKSNYRSKIRKGLKLYDVRVINPLEHSDALYEVMNEAMGTYSEVCSVKVDRDEFINDLKEWEDGVTFAAFSKEDQSIAGHMFVRLYPGYATLSVLKAKPSEEKNQVNAAIIYSVLDHFASQLSQGMYFLAGERTINHDTNMHIYLEKYFGFRRAYCRLKLQYRPAVRFFVNLLYPVRGLFKRFKIARLFCQIDGVLKMEEISRNCTVGCCKLKEG